MLRLEDISSLFSYKDILVPEKGDSQIYDPTRRETYRKAISCLLVKYLLIEQVYIILDTMGIEMSKCVQQGFGNK